MVQPHRVRQLHKKPRKEPFDYAVYFFMIATPLFEVPQAYTIYSSQNAANVSLFTWGFFFVSSVVWLTYSIKHKLVPFIYMYVIYMLVEAVIVMGIFMYK